MKIIPRTKTPSLIVDTVAHGTWDLSKQQPEHFTFLVFYRGHH